LLIDHHADTNLIDYDGNNAAMHAILNHYFEVAKLLDESIEIPSQAWIKEKNKSDTEARVKRINEKEKAKKESLDKDHSSYSHAYPELLTLNDSFFQPSFLKLIRDEAELELIRFQQTTSVVSVDNNRTSSTSRGDVSVTTVREVIPDVYELEVFTEEFCKKLISEVGYIENSGLKLTRPNSMNNYGLVFDQFGFKEMMHKLVMEFIEPLANKLFSKEKVKPSANCSADDEVFIWLRSRMYRETNYLTNQSVIRFKGHHAFMVKYKKGQDETLDEHADSSLITLNVCLGKTFTGGHVYFRPLETEEDNMMEYRPVMGKAILHLGRHRHGVNRLQSGERCNLIVWAR